MSSSGDSIDSIISDLEDGAHALSEQVTSILMDPPYNSEEFAAQSMAFAHRARAIASAVARGKQCKRQTPNMKDVEVVQEMLGFLTQGKQKLERNLKEFGWGGNESHEGYHPEKLQTLFNESIERCESFINSQGGPDARRGFKIQLESLLGALGEFEDAMALVYSAVDSDPDIAGRGYDIARPILSPVYTKLKGLPDAVIQQRLSFDKVKAALRGAKVKIVEGAEAAGIKTQDKDLMAPITQVLVRANQLCDQAASLECDQQAALLK